MSFADETRATLEEYGKWLIDNAEWIADEIAGGCKQWAILLEAGRNGMFPDVNVRVRVVAEKTTLVDEDSFIWRDERELVLDETFVYGRPLEAVTDDNEREILDAYRFTRALTDDPEVL